MSRRWAWLGALALAVHLPAGAWDVSDGGDADSGMNGCVLRSPPVTVNDGYVETTVRLVLDGEHIAVIADAPLDPEFDDMSVSVDGGDSLGVPEVASRYVARLDASRDLLDEFRRGLEAEVHLRLWPTWPSLGRVGFPFDLRGFTRSMDSLTDCIGDQD